MPTPFLNAGATSKYFDAVMRGRLFFACNSAIQALSVNSATATGFILSNPVTSGVNLVILQACIAIASAPGAQSNLIWTGTLLTTAEAATTHSVALVVKNALIGSAFAVGSGKADSSATVPAPAAIRAIGGGPVGASTINTAYIRDDVDGLLILAPGCVISIQAMTTAISCVISAAWEEVPV